MVLGGHKKFQRYISTGPSDPYTKIVLHYIAVQWISFGYDLGIERQNTGHKSIIPSVTCYITLNT